MRLLGFSVMLGGRSLSDPLGGKKIKKKIFREEPELLYIKKKRIAGAVALTARD